MRVLSLKFSVFSGDGNVTSVGGADFGLIRIPTSEGIGSQRKVSEGLENCEGRISSFECCEAFGHENAQKTQKGNLMDNGQLRTRGDWRLEASATLLEGKWQAKEMASSEFQISNSQVGRARHLLSGIRGNLAGEGNWRQLTAVKFLILDFQMRTQITRCCKKQNVNGSVQGVYTFARCFEIRRQCSQSRRSKVGGH